MMYDYSKYENASPKQIIHALSLAEKRAQKLALEVKENEKFFKFLQKKLNNSFSIKKAKHKRNVPNNETIKALNNARSIGVFDSFDEAKKALMSDDWWEKLISKILSKKTIDRF